MAALLARCSLRPEDLRDTACRQLAGPAGSSWEDTEQQMGRTCLSMSLSGESHTAQAATPHTVSSKDASASTKARGGPLLQGRGGAAGDVYHVVRDHHAPLRLGHCSEKELSSRGD